MNNFKLIKSNKNYKFYILTGIIIVLLSVIAFSKTYAIYRLQKEFDTMKNKIGTYSMGDVRVAVTVDGQEVKTFPSYETNYKVDSIECTNGVSAQWSAVNWSLNITDMKATSTKCTVNFDSTKKSDETPIAYTKEELIALNDSLTNDFKSQLKTELLNETYPVGSIYISTTDDTVTKVQTKFGGTWVKYSEGTTLVGAGTKYAANSTGGSSTVTLSTSNLPSHTHSIPVLSGSASSAGSHTHSIPALSGTTSAAGAHTPTIYTRMVGYTGWPTATVYSYAFNWGNTVFSNPDSGTRTLYYSASQLPVYAGAVADHTHTVTTAASTSGSAGAHTHTVSTTASTSGATGSASAVNIQNPYTAVYMYKRTA